MVQLRMMLPNPINPTEYAPLGPENDADGKHHDRYHADDAFAEGACEYTERGSESGARGFVEFVAAHQFKNHCAEEGADDDSGQVEKEAHQTADKGTQHAAPRRAKPFRAVHAGKMIQHD